MADATVASALPTIVVPNSDYGRSGYTGGFCPSDAALVRAGQSQDAHLINLVAAKDAQRESVETRHLLALQMKDSEIASERARSAVMIEMASLKASVAADGDRTRDLVTALMSKIIK